MCGRTIVVEGIVPRRLWVYGNKIPIYPIFYLLDGDYQPKVLGRGDFAGWSFRGLGLQGALLHSLGVMGLRFRAWGTLT